MRELLIFLTCFLLLVMGIAFYSLIKLLQGNIRLIERERNVHNLQVSELLDRLAHAEGKPWTLPPRPVEPLEEEPEDFTEQVNWREV